MTAENIRGRLVNEKSMSEKEEMKENIRYLLWSAWIQIKDKNQRLNYEIIACQ